MKNNCLKSVEAEHTVVSVRDIFSTYPQFSIKFCFIEALAFHDHFVY